MSLLRERTVRSTRPLPDEADLSEPRARRAVEPGVVLRASGAIAVLVVGAVHLDQYFAVHFDVVPTIGPLFLLNFIGATIVGVVLLVPLGRFGRNAADLVHGVAALGAIGIALPSIVFLVLSEYQPVFGLMEFGYRFVLVLVLVSEALAAVSLGGFLVLTFVARARRATSVRPMTPRILSR
jgi:hypothetical protein